LFVCLFVCFDDNKEILNSFRKYLFLCLMIVLIL
jgi:hypothetical protein